MGVLTVSIRPAVRVVKIRRSPMSAAVYSLVLAQEVLSCT